MAEYSAYEPSDELAVPYVASEAESSSAYGSSEAAAYAEESAEVYGAEYTEAPDAYIPVIESLEDLELYTTCMNIETDALVLHQQCVDVQMQCDELMWDAAVDESNSEFGEVLNNATEEALRQCLSERTNLMLEMREVWDRYFQAGCAYDNQGDILGVNLYDPCTNNPTDFELGSD